MELGPGRIKTYLQGDVDPVTGAPIIAAPVVGGELTITVPKGKIWRIVIIKWTLVTSAVVVNRASALQIIDTTHIGGNVIANDLGNGFAQAASLNAIYNWQSGANGTGSMSANNSVLGSLPSDLYLLEGWQVKSRTVAIDAGDLYSAVSVLVEEWAAPGV